MAILSTIFCFWLFASLVGVNGGFRELAQRYREAKCATLALNALEYDAPSTGDDDFLGHE